MYAQRLSEVINLTLEVELPLLRSVDISFVSKIKQLLLIIAESAPFKPNISAISTKIGINRQTLLAYLHHLSDAGLIRHLYKESHGISRLQKPDKIYLDNTNMAYALTAQRPEMGTLRETFFANQLGYQHDLQYWIIEKTDIQRASKVRSTQGLIVHVFGKIAAAISKWVF